MRPANLDPKPQFQALIPILIRGVPGHDPNVVNGRGLHVLSCTVSPCILWIPASSSFPAERHWDWLELHDESASMCILQQTGLTQARTGLPIMRTSRARSFEHRLHVAVEAVHLVTSSLDRESRESICRRTDAPAAGRVPSPPSGPARSTCNWKDQTPSTYARFAYLLCVTRLMLPSGKIHWYVEPLHTGAKSLSANHMALLHGADTIRTL